MSKFTEKEWIEDFQEFVKSEGAVVPKDVTATILSRVHKDLNPSPWLVFSKLLGVHAIGGTFSLAICNQFGISPFQTGFSLSDYFMKFGNSTCMFLCGLIFLSLSLLLSRLLLRPEELVVLKRSAGLQVFGLSMISLGVFAILGAPLALSVALLWLAGAMLGGMSIALVPGTTASGGFDLGAGR
jgi:hypothetical protein